jgi:tetratricopeptide (TPR) repeat protein
MLMNLGVIVGAQGRHLEAEILMKRALQLRRAAYESDHPEIAKNLCNLAQCQANMGKPEARDTAQQALDALSKSLGPDHSFSREAFPILRAIAAGSRTRPATSAAEVALAAQIHAGKAAVEAGDHRLAVDLMTLAVDRARELGIPEMEASACGILAPALFSLDERDEAFVQARRALAIAEELSIAEGVAHFRGLIQLMESVGPFPRGIRGADWNARIHAAWQQAQHGDPDAACRALVQIAEQTHEESAYGLEANARIFLGQILLARGERAVAKTELLHALKLAEAHDEANAAEQIRALLVQVERA